MAFAFDALGYAKHLRSIAVPQDQAEAHAEAERERTISYLIGEGLRKVFNKNNRA